MSQSKPARRLVSIQAAAEYLGLSPLTVRRRIAAGEIRAFRTGAGSNNPIRVDLEQIDSEFLRPMSTGGGDTR